MRKMNNCQLKQLWCLLFTLLVSNASTAQNAHFVFDTLPALRQYSTHSYIYKIPEDSVWTIVYGTYNIPEPDAPWLQKLSYTIPVSKKDSLMATDVVTPGFYLIVGINRNNVNTYIQRKAAFSSRIIHLGDIQILEVTDMQGKTIKDAEVTIQKKFIQYDDQMKGYLLTDFVDKDTVCIRKNGDVEYHVCSVNKRNYDDYNEGRNNRYYNEEEYPKYNGYLVTNKPKYLPKDTVKFKAYILDPLTGKPSNASLLVRIITEDYESSFLFEEERERKENERKMLEEKRNKRSNNDSENEEDTEDEDQSETTDGIITLNKNLKPEEPGVYFSEFVLGDSIEMDKTYVLLLKDMQTGNLIHQQFLTEDYLLDEAYMKVKGEDYPYYQKGDTVKLYGYAYNSNNLPLFDGSVSITVRAGYINYRKPDTLRVPDTLYHIEKTLDPSGETYLGFSTKDFPDIGGSFQCNVSLVNSNYERKDTVFYIEYIPRPYYLHTHQHGDTMIAEVIKNKKSVAATGYYIKGYYNSIKYPIKYPFNYIIDPHDDVLTFTMDSINKTAATSINASISDDILKITEYYLNDTAYMKVTNPQHTLLRYTAYTGKKYIGYGQLQSDTTIKFYSPDGETISVFTHRFWKHDNYDTRYIYKYDKNLQIDIIKKDMVYPGQTDSISINLKNANGKPIIGTNLTVLAFNAQFTESFIPDLPYGGIIKPGITNANPVRQINRIEYAPNRSILLRDKQWLRLAGMDTLFFYSHIFMSPKMVTTIQHNLPGTHQPQLGVHVYKDGQFLSPAIIYIDDQPAYYYGAFSTNPNALYITHGKHKITVRTSQGLYDAIVTMQPATKLNLFINIDKLPIAYQKKQPDTLTPNEVNALSRSLLQYRSENFRYNYNNINYNSSNENILLTQASYQYKFYPNHSNTLVGPFRFSDSIHFYQYNNTKRKFIAEPNYIFTIRDGMLRLEKNATEQLLKGSRIRSDIYWPDLGIKAARLVNIDSLLVNDTADAVTLTYNKQKSNPKIIKAKIEYKKTANKNEQSILKGIVLDEKKEPIIGAIVQVLEGSVVKGGAATDYDGNFVVKPIKTGQYDIKVMFSGYVTQLIKNVMVYKDRTSVLKINLRPSNTSLDEVVVVAYKVPLIDRYESSSNTITSEQIEKMPVRTTDAVAYTAPGVYSNSNDLSLNGGRENGTMYIVDGIQVRGSAGMNLASAGGNVEDLIKDLTGGNSNKSPILSNNKSEQFISNFMNNMMKASGGRKNFRDYAIWEPNLWTDKRGDTKFTVTYPDNMTAWKTYVLAMNEKGFTGQSFLLTRAFKPLAAQLSTPRFLLYGDSVEAIGKVMNYTQQAFNLKTIYQQNGKDISSNTMLVNNGKVESLPAFVPYGQTTDTAMLALTYGINVENGYNDGEEKLIPVYQLGTTEGKGDFFRMMKDTIVHSKPVNSNKFTGKTIIQVDGSLVEVMLREIENLKLYPHGCTEQLTTKLLAISYEEDVKRLLNNEQLNNTEVKKQILEQLIRAQNKNGSFGWFSGNSADYRITNYVVSTMHKVNKDGWLDVVIRRGMEFLKDHLKDMPENDLITSLSTLSAANYKADYAQYTTGLDTLRLNTYDSLAIIKIKQEQSLPYRKELDSLVKSADRNTDGLSWGRYTYDWYRDDLATTLLAYKIIKRDSVYHPLGDSILQYILSKRKNGYYQNTAASGLVLTTLLPDLLKQTKEDPNKRTRVYISGSLADTVTKFPKTYRFSNKNASYSFEKKGISPVFVSVMYSYLNTKPQVDSTTFKVNTLFIQGNDTVTTLKRGEKVTLRTVVTCIKDDAEYIMIEIPIPAGCVQIKSRNNSYYGYNEVNRENYKDRTNIFCRQLYPGTYIFDVELEPRYKGNFSLNPAKAGMMYHPDEYGHTAIKKVIIK